MGLRTRRTTHRHVLAASVSVFSACDAMGIEPLVQQPTPLINEHVDLNVYYTSADGGTWDLRPYDGDFGGFAIPGNEALLHVDHRSLLTVPASGFEFVGVSGGEQAYVLTQGQNPELLYLGFAGYGATPTNQWDRYNPSSESGGRVSGLGRWLKVSLDSVQGPGEFSLWQSGDSSPTVFMSTASGGVTADDAMWIVTGGHLHYNFGFTERGLYRVNLVPSGYLGDDGLSTPNTAGYSQAASPFAVYFNVDPGYATAGVTLSSTLPTRGATAANSSGFSEVVLAGHPADGAVSVSNVDSASPVYVLLDLTDNTELGALVVALSGTASYSPGHPTYLSEIYFLDDVPATATIDNSLLPSHAGYNLGLRFDVPPGESFDFEFDLSMILDGVELDRIGVAASPIEICLADVNGDGAVSPADFSAWVAAFNMGAPQCDQNADGSCTPADFSAWVANFNAGCP
ncbi:MAG: choice-of-anchor M domain-containing protein [Phycisphaerales bacterium JB058]